MAVMRGTAWRDRWRERWGLFLRAPGEEGRWEPGRPWVYQTHSSYQEPARSRLSQCKTAADERVLRDAYLRAYLRVPDASVDEVGVALKITRTCPFMLPSLDSYCTGKNVLQSHPEKLGDKMVRSSKLRGWMTRHSGLFSGEYHAVDVKRSSFNCTFFLAWFILLLRIEGSFIPFIISVPLPRNVTKQLPSTCDGMSLEYVQSWPPCGAAEQEDIQCYSDERATSGNWEGRENHYDQPHQLCAWC